MNIGVTKVFGNANTSAEQTLDIADPLDPSQISTNKGTNGVKTGDGMGFNISYAAGGLHAGYTLDTVTNTGIALGTKNIVRNSDPDSGTYSIASQLVTGSAGQKNKTTTLALSYDLGMAKPSYSNAKMSVGTQSIQADMFALSVPMGQATAFISTSSGKIVLTGAEFKAKGMQYGINYALSKRTVAYWHGGNQTLTLQANGADVKSSGYGIGVHHSF